MISSVCWVPRGAAKAVPDRVEPTEEELQAAQQALEGLDLDIKQDGADEEFEDEDEANDAGMDVEAEVAQAQAVAAALNAGGNRAAGKSGNDIEDALKELDLDNYDADEQDAEAAMVARILGAGENGGLAYYGSNEEDPYITLNDDSASEIEDLTFQSTDLVILATRHEEDVSALEVWVYEEGETTSDGFTTGSNSYVHHDILLPAFPLCTAWLNCDVTGKREDGKANLVAVGTMDPGIEVWDLDVVDVVEPLTVLGGEERGASSSAAAAEEEVAGAAEKKKKKKAKKKKKTKKILRPDSHEDSVLGLAWNAEFRNVLASCSADTTVKVWDLATQKCEHTLRIHKGKVQAVAWNPAEAPILLSGAFDKTACVTDMRQPTQASVSWSVTADVEALCWVPYNPTSFLVSSEDGLVACFDARGGAGSKPLFHLSAHDKATCALSFCPGAEGLLATASTDKKVKLWDITENKPHLVATEDLKAGAIFTLGFCHDASHLLAAAGSMGSLSIWDIRCNAAVAARYPQLLKGFSKLDIKVKPGVAKDEMTEESDED